MEFPAKIDNQKLIKKGVKITLIIDKEDMVEVMRDIHKFIEKPLIIDMQIDVQKRQQELNTITGDQRKKIYAIFKDIANHTGGNKDYVKDNLKRMFTQNTEYNDFSLSNCSKELASDFIEFIIEFAFEYGVELSEHPKKLIDDINAYLVICIRNKICAVCGRQAEIHHVDTIGMGHNRNKTDDSAKRKIALCRKHHREAHDEGWETFKQKHHVNGVIYDGE